MFCVDKIKYEHLAILSDLKRCQFAPRIAISYLCICCQFEDSQIILDKIIPHDEPSQHLNATKLMRAHFFAEKVSLSFGTYNSEFLEYLVKNYCIRTRFNVV